MFESTLIKKLGEQFILDYLAALIRESIPIHSYYTFLSYDGPSTIGSFWPQLLPGSSRHALWVDLNIFCTLSGGIGYRQLFNPLSFFGVYGYLEWPNWAVRPWGALSLIKLASKRL